MSDWFRQSEDNDGWINEYNGRDKPDNFPPENDDDDNDDEEWYRDVCPWR